MSDATFKDRIPSKDLLTKFNLLAVRRVVQRNRLRWFGHVVRMDNDNWVKKCMTFEVKAIEGGGGSEVKNTCSTNIKELFTPNSMLFMEFKNLFPFLRYLRSKFKNGHFRAKKSTKNGVFLLTASELFLLMALCLPKMRKLNEFSWLTIKKHTSAWKGVKKI